MFNKLKIFFKDMIKGQLKLILILLPVWVLPHLMVKTTNYKLAEFTIILNVVLIFMLYGLSIIRNSKMYNTIYNLLVQHNNLSDENTKIITAASFATTVFWNVFSFLVIVFIVNNRVDVIPSQITYYISSAVMFLLTVIGFQGMDYYKKFFKSLDQDFINKLEA